MIDNIILLLTFPASSLTEEIYHDYLHNIITTKNSKTNILRCIQNDLSPLILRQTCQRCVKCYTIVTIIVYSPRQIHRRLREMFL